MMVIEFMMVIILGIIIPLGLYTLAILFLKWYYNKK